MNLKKSVGNMYKWVDFTHCHLGGECPHGCVYCYVRSFPFRPAKYQGPLRLIEKEFAVNYGKGRTIFIENCNDLFAGAVPEEFIAKILAHCRHYPENTYVFQTKNPANARGWISLFPLKSILGCTLETNRVSVMNVSGAPSPVERITAMQWSRCRKFVTVEPIMDFDVDELAWAISCMSPEFVNIGADSKRHNLPEPPAEKVHALIAKLTECGIEIREKHNLERLLK